MELQRSHTSSDAVTQGCSVKKVFLEISQNSQENTCARVQATLLKKKLWHRCFPVNFLEFLRTTFLTEHLRWLRMRVVFNKLPVTNWNRTALTISKLWRLGLYLSLIVLIVLHWTNLERRHQPEPLQILSKVLFKVAS